MSGTVKRAGPTPKYLTELTVNGELQVSERLSFDQIKEVERFIKLLVKA